MNIFTLIIMIIFIAAVFGTAIYMLVNHIKTKRKIKNKIEEEIKENE